MAIIPIIFFALVAGLGLGFGSTSSSEAYSSSLEITPDSGSSSSSGASEVALPTKVVKSLFKYREELPSCGTISGGGGADQWACLQDAADALRDSRGPSAGAGAELVIEDTTTEGDPVRRYYRVSAGQLELFADNHRDAFRGDQAWTYVSCEIPDDVRMGCPDS